MNDDIAERTRQAVMAVWQANKPVYVALVALILQAAAKDDLTPEERAAVAAEAHKVAGAVGTFGFKDASETAKAIEQLLDGNSRLDVDRFRDLANSLLRSLEP